MTEALFERTLQAVYLDDLDISTVKSKDHIYYKQIRDFEQRKLIFLMSLDISTCHTKQIDLSHFMAYP